MWLCFSQRNALLSEMGRLFLLYAAYNGHILKKKLEKHLLTNDQTRDEGKKTNTKRHHPILKTSTTRETRCQGTTDWHLFIRWPAYYRHALTRQLQLHPQGTHIPTQKMGLGELHNKGYWDGQSATVFAFKRSGKKNQLDVAKKSSMRHKSRKLSKLW